MDADPAVVAPPGGSRRDGSRRDGPSWGRRRRTPAWIWGLAILVLFVTVVASTWTRWDRREVSLDAWRCTGTPAVDMTWEQLQEDAGCAPAQVAATLQISQGVAPLDAGSTTDPAVVPGVDGDAVDYSLQVRLEDPARSVVVVDLSLTPPAPAHEMDGDVAGLRWNSLFDPAESEEFAVLVGAPPAGG